MARLRFIYHAVHRWPFFKICGFSQGRWTADIEADFDDSQLQADVLSCDGSSDAVISGFKAIIERDVRCLVVSSESGRHRSIVIAHIVADSVNLLTQEGGNRRSCQAKVFAMIDYGSSNVDLDRFIDDVKSWTHEPRHVVVGA